MYLGHKVDRKGAIEVPDDEQTVLREVVLLVVWLDTMRHPHPEGKEVRRSYFPRVFPLLIQGITNLVPSLQHMS